MTKMKLIRFVPLVLCLVLGFASQAFAKPLVFVSIVPQKYFVEQIAGDLVDVEALVAPGVSPHIYEPTPSQMAALSKAKAYFAIGIALEQTWLPRINKTAPSMRIVYTQRGIKKLPMAAHDHHDEDEHADHHEHEGEKHHEHDEHATEHDEHEHDHGTLDPHIWLDPVLTRTIAENTCEGLIKADPDNHATYEANLAKFLRELDTLHTDIAAVIDTVPTDRRAFMVFHPSWGYYANRYGLTQIPIEVGGREPSPKELAAVVTQARDKGVTVIFIQPQTSKRTATVIAREIGAQVKELDPLSANWKENLLEATQTFKTVLR